MYNTAQQPHSISHSQEEDNETYDYNTDSAPNP